MRKLILTAAVAVFAAANGFTHGAMEYIALDSYDAAEKGETVFHLQYDYMVEDREDSGLDHWEITPGFSYNFIDGLSFDVHTHFAKFGNNLLVDEEKANYAPFGPSPFIEAAAFKAQYNIGGIKPVNVAAAAVYEIPTQRSRDLLDGKEVVEGILVLSRGFGEHSNVTLNIKAGKDGDEDIREWAFGVKTPLSRDPHGISGGIEVFSSFEDMEDNWSILPGIYMPVGAENTIFKTGVGFGDKSMNVNLTLMYNF